ncbi:2,3-bisphosphoglycerate-dependent phosphoglycerate mutase [Apilactobacillus apisilvae]|uniref:2,3-bisphosphoglycerate-dependent phosphoglycerate mutase n=1 Tax=Apilactobacillus apisilvae TaxID=2923364 RepID=A0ABY4PH96_9LACO|nr:2,3-bisphosphoglycerate-dependent phosphoglycerate mutase [Apilactobacillus apisilvae]UQS85030.1 2,3-bisphosphoglycerate-dependent phosphoglycerate mutase [Apilactobacillus apisilvae]
MAYLVLMRHGESQANRDNIFTGWNDVPLTNKGIEQAHKAGKFIKNLDINFTDVHTSVLMRAIDTAHIVLKEINQEYINEHKTWHLNERHYGALRGQKKINIKKKYGEKQFKLWRRSFDSIPPLLDYPDDDLRYSRIGIKEPRGESLKMAYIRILNYWIDQIAPKLLDGHNQLLVAHGSTLRALVKYLDNISDQDIDKVEIPNGEPIIYKLDDNLNVISKIIK